MLITLLFFIGCLHLKSAPFSVLFYALILKLSDENPFTHKKFFKEKKNGITVYKNTNEVNADRLLNKTQFTLDKNTSYHIKVNIYDEKNWIPLLKWKKEKSDEN